MRSYRATGRAPAGGRQCPLRCFTDLDVKVPSAALIEDAFTVVVDASSIGRLGT